MQTSSLFPESASVFQPLPDEDTVPAASIDIVIDGAPHRARAHDSVASALLLAGVTACRTTPVTGKPRAPFCMMGVCFDCLVTIDGVPSQRACRVRVQQGMSIATQAGAPRIGR